MTGAAIQTLLYPFETGLLVWPEEGEQTLFINAENTPGLENFPSLDVHQWRKSLGALPGNPLETLPENATYHHIILHSTKQQEESKYLLGRAHLALREGGLLVAAAANDAGGRRLQGLFQELGLDPQSESKNKCRAVWAKKVSESAAAQDWAESFGTQEILDGKYVSQPGLFSWNEVDLGSQLLAAYIPDDLKGSGADFGCGYGYLSSELLKTSSKVKTLFCIDDDSRALTCCEKNLSKINPSAGIFYQWHDLTQKPDIQNLDWVIMNPPFHSGKDTLSSLGQNMIKTASSVLHKGGRLYMVANAHLPYEAVLQEYFYNVEKLTEQQGYKIYQAVK